MSQITGTCQVDVSGVFVFDSPAFQNAANAIYEQKKAFDANPANIARKKVYTFKTDFERMQYKLGLYGRASTGQR